MRRLSLFCLLFILAIFQFNSADAQRDEWRIIKKIRTETNGQKFNTEYTYSNNAQIESVKYLTIGDAVNITISDFKFDRNKKPSSYIVTWNREGAKANISLKYDNDGRLIELKKVDANRETSLFTYRYSEKEIFIVEQKSNTNSGNIKDNKTTFYTEQGDYNVTTSNAASQTITSVITLKQINSVPKSYPESFMGGFEAPRFLGVTAFGSEPEITVTKNDIGLIKSLTWVNRSGTRKNEYEYVNTKKSEPIVTTPNEKNVATIINTNISCTAGKTIVERKLKSQDGVQSVKIDISTGSLSLAYSSDGTTYDEIINLINEAGFDADRKKSTASDKNPCSKKTGPLTKQIGLNIFDARKGFAKAPIKFVPFVVTPNAAQKGFKMDSLYTWVAPDGKTKQATGEEILTQVNEMEKELNLRGHTLRKRDVFNGLNYRLVNPNALLKIPKAISKNASTVQFSTNKSPNFSSIPVIKTRLNKLPGLLGAIANTIPGDVGIYFGNITSNRGEYQGMISTTGTIDNSKCNTQCPLDITLSLDATKIQSLNISQCVLEISANPNRQPNDDEEALAVGKFNFKSPAKEKNGILNVTVNGDVPPANHTLFYFPVILNDLSKLGKAAIQPAFYYAYVKFYNAKGELLSYSSYNTATLENKIEVPIFLGANKAVSVSLGDAYTDPTNMFGVYYKADKLQSTYTTKRDDATLIITEDAKISGNIEIGVQYFNFWYLLDNDKPKVSKSSIIAANFSSVYTKKYIAGKGIRIPASNKSNDMNGYAGYQVNYSLYDFDLLKDQNYDKSSNNTESTIVNYQVFDKQFFIGPVPCRATVNLEGNASLSRQATMDTLKNGNVSISAGVTPQIKLTMKGSGGVDAGIVYAKVFCNVDVIQMKLPITVNASSNADVNADLTITALSGEVYFQAGLCIPVPFFDDICTNFRVDIFKWTGPSKTYPLVK